MKVQLVKLAHARSGDKGDTANVGLIALRDETYPILVREVTAQLKQRATLHVVEGADHSFHVLARSGRNDPQVREELLDTMAGWMLAL